MEFTEYDIQSIPINFKSVNKSRCAIHCLQPVNFKIANNNNIRKN